MKAKSKIAMFDGRQILIGDFVKVEFDEASLGWVIVSRVKGPKSVAATILQDRGARYKQGRQMGIHLKWVREHRTKDNPPVLWSNSQ